MSAWAAGLAVLVLGGVGLEVLRRRGAAWGAPTWLLRGGLVAAAALGAAGPTVPRPAGARARALVIDGSRSLTRGARAVDRLALEGVADLDADDQVAVVLFGARPVTALGWRSARPAPGMAQARARPVDAWGSDLGAALRLAADLLGEQGLPGEVLLVSDGRDTAGDALAAAAALRARGVPLYALAPDAAPPVGARLAWLDAPTRASPGERVRVRLEAQALGPGELRLELRAQLPDGEEQPIGQLVGAAAPGLPLTASFLTPPLPAGEVALRARVRCSGRDDAAEDDALEARVLVGDRRRVLRVGQPLGGDERAVAPADLAAALTAEPADLVLLAEVPARALPVEATRALAAAVEAGTGLAVLGAEAAFGPGGYAEGPLEALLPVTCGPGQERERALWLAVALDASGSMAGAGAASPYLTALEAALPVKLLRAEDRLAVVLFADRPTLVQPLGPAPPDLLEQLAAHEPRGGTDIGAGLAEGLQAVLASGEAERRVVLATDSRDEQPRRHLGRLRALAAQLAGRRARALLVQIGDEPSDTLEALATALRPDVEAEVARAADAGPALAALVEGELLAGRGDVRRGSFAVRPSAAGQALSLPDPGLVPAFAPVRAREEPAYAAEVLASVLDPETGSPPAAVLGRRGLGRTLALPLPLAGASPLLASLREQLLPPRADLSLTARRQGREVALEARGRVPPEGLRVRLEGPGAARSEAPLIPWTPGLARACLTAPSQGALVAVALDAEGRRLAAAALPGAAHDELALPGPDLALLHALCAATGGELLPTPPTPERPLRPPGEGARALDLTPWAALLALALLLLDAGLLTLRTRASPRTALSAPRAAAP